MNASSLDRILRQVLVVPTLAVLIGAAALLWQMHSANLNVRQIQRADDTIAQIIELEKLMDDQETALRGFQISGDPQFLEPYRAAEPRIPLNFTRLRSSEVFRSRAASIDGLQTSIDLWHRKFADPLLAIANSGRPVPDPTLSLEDKILFDGIRSDIGSLSVVAQQQRDQDIARWQDQVRRMSLVLLGLALGIGLTIGFYSRRLISQVSASFRQTNQALHLRADELYRSEVKLRTTLESIGDGVIACDASGAIDSMNHVAQQLTGWSLAKARGRPLAEVFHIVDEDTREDAEDPIAKIKRLDKVVGIPKHSRLVQQDGTELIIDDSGAPIRDLDGNLIGSVIVFRDVTLATRSREALLANEKLAVAGRLAATIAHEIHNPLDSVANLLYLMEGECTPEESRHFLALARQEITRVTQISRAMLSLYREAKAPVPIDVSEMLESLLLLMERRFRTLGVEVATSLPPNLIIHGFPAELRQVFTNLLTNAAEASARSIAADELAGANSLPPSDPVPLLEVKAQACPAGANSKGMRREAGVLVTIQDEGPGIPDAIRENLFQPFFTTKGEQGTGLGLWVSKGIITKHGGTIDFTSDTSPEGHGTTFSVFLATHPVINAGGD